ncbi:MAG: hypothetical protein Q8R16_00030 [bacterium]|nr:hypothetical protein [bacterium]
MSENKKERIGIREAIAALIVALFQSEIGWMVLALVVIMGGGAIVGCIEQLPKAWSGLPAIISTQELAGRTIKDATSSRCFSVVQQDGQPRFVSADCPKGK